MGRFVPDTVEYFNDRRPTTDLEATSGDTEPGEEP
jgi:hypothetical protein